MAYNFNDDTVSPPVARPLQGSAGAAAPARADEPSTSADRATSEAPQSPGFTRFNSCRWQQPKEEGTVAFCTHREVKPYAGTTAFDADAWCPECQYYKLRRAPKKRSPDDYSY